MPYNEELVARVSEVLKKRKIRAQQKRMIGGLCFMVSDKMRCGVIGNDLMVRVDPALHEQVLKKKGCRRMELGGRPLKEFLVVDQKVITSNADLESWIARALPYNPKTKASRK